MNSDEKLLFSTQPYYKEIKLIDRKVRNIILSIIVPFLITIILSVYLYFWGQFHNGIWSENSGLNTALIIILGTGTGYLILITILSYIRNHRLTLRDTKYFITDQQIISIAPYFNDEYLVIPLAYENISEYFIEKQNNKPFLHVFFKTRVISSEEMDNCFMITRHIKRQDDGIILENQTIFKLPERLFILIWRKVKETDNLGEILFQYLSKKLKNIPLNHSMIERIEAHIGG